MSRTARLLSTFIKGGFLLAELGNLDNLNHLRPQPVHKSSIGNKALFSEVANPNGRGPPVYEEKARHAENRGRAQQSNSNGLIAQHPKPGNSNLDWRTFYDNARGNTDATIKAVYQALGEGLIDDTEAAAIDAALRSQQARLAKGQAAGPAPLRQVNSASVARRFKPRRYQASPDRRASRERRRMLARGGHMPPDVRTHYTEGEASALTIIAGEVKRQGFCDLPIDKIAALAGLSRTTAQNALREARSCGHITVQGRPVPGRKNLTNIVRIVSPEWLAWLKRGPAIGFKSLPSRILSPTKREESQQRRATPMPWEAYRGIREKPGWGKSHFEHNHGF